MNGFDDEDVAPEDESPEANHENEFDEIDDDQLSEPANQTEDNGSQNQSQHDTTQENDADHDFLDEDDFDEDFDDDFDEEAEEETGYGA